MTDIHIFNSSPDAVEVAVMCVMTRRLRPANVTADR